MKSDHSQKTEDMENEVQSLAETQTITCHRKTLKLTISDGQAGV